MARGKVEFKEDRAGEHRFRVEAGNGEGVGSSEGFASSHRDAVRGFFDAARAYHEAAEKLLEEHPEYSEYV